MGFYGPISKLLIKNGILIPPSEVSESRNISTCTNVSVASAFEAPR
jgi:hypothetical protein